MKPLIQINNEVREMTDEEFAEFEAAKLQEQEQALLLKADEVRAERNQKLKDSDWTQLADAALTDEEKAAWAEYRQSLRDVPQQEGFPWEVVWQNQP